MPLTIAATTESDSSDLTLDETITGNYSLGNVNSLTGELTNGLFFSTSGNNQIINLEAVTQVRGTKLSNAKGVSRVGLFSAKNISTASGPTIQMINLKAETLISSNGTVFSSTSYEGSFE